MFQPFEDRLQFIWVNHLSFADVLKRTATLPPHSAILFLVLSIDAQGFSSSEDRALTELHNSANAPVFGLFAHQLGRGIVGGPLLSTDENGRNAATVALRILRGESPGSIRTAAQRPGPPIYDARELERWGIRESLLPAGSVIHFRQPTVWGQYRSYIVGGTILVGLQAALIVGLVVQRIRRRRMEMALRESEQRFRVMAEQNQDLAGRLINAQEAERTRIARDLHDDLSQQLAGVAIMLSVLKRKLGSPGSEAEVAQTVTTLQSRTAAATESVRTLSHELHPGVLEHSGLAEALRRYCEGIGEHHPVKVQLSTEDGLDSLSNAVALCLFRVSQEALTNAVRHSRAAAIIVRLSTTNGRVELEVRDNGIGFVPSERTRNGLGLRSMDERVRLASGHVHIESRPGHGTQLLVSIPHQRPAVISPG